MSMSIIGIAFICVMVTALIFAIVGAIFDVPRNRGPAESVFGRMSILLTIIGFLMLIAAVSLKILNGVFGWLI